MFLICHLWCKTFSQFLQGINLCLGFTLKLTFVAANLFNPPPLPCSLSPALYIFTFTQYKATWLCSNSKNSFDLPILGLQFWIHCWAHNNIPSCYIMYQPSISNHLSTAIFIYPCPLLYSFSPSCFL